MTTTVLLFVEHELNEREVAETLEALADRRVEGEDPVDVTVLVPCAARWLVVLMDDLVAAHGVKASLPLDDARHDATDARASARRILRHVLAALRAGSHPARGELVAVREAVRDLAAEAHARHASTVLVVTSPHRLSHALHRDLEHRLRRAGVTHVVRVNGAGAVASA